MVVPKQLFQFRPLDTNPHKVYSPGINVKTTILFIVVSSTHDETVTFRLFNDNDGEVFDEESQITWDEDVNPKLPTEKKGKYMLDSPSSSFGVRSNMAGKLNFTGWGIEVK